MEDHDSAKRQVEQEKKLKKAEEDLKKIRDISSVQAKKAQDSLLKNSMFFRPSDISEQAKFEIGKAATTTGGIGVCSKCWWSYGCLRCVPAKSLSFMRKEAAKANVEVVGLLEPVRRWTADFASPPTASSVALRQSENHMGKNAQLSRGFVASCAPPNGGDGCGGGWSEWVFDLMASQGSPTGGRSGSAGSTGVSKEYLVACASGCHPYFGHGDGTEHFAVSGSAPPCPTQCGNANFGRTMNEDKFHLHTGNYILIASYYHPTPEKVYHLAREALLSGGPIPAYLYADGGFMGYSSGIYTHTCDQNANHAITVVGYGPDYWNCCWVAGLNSWGEWWGDGGTFKVGLCVARHGVDTLDMWIGPRGPSGHHLARWRLPMGSFLLTNFGFNSNAKCDEF
eukprot:Skav211792  [mRNA]  locus=scaffold305:240229:245947:+ [translate_table: standard]